MCVAPSSFISCSALRVGTWSLFWTNSTAPLSPLRLPPGCRREGQCERMQSFEAKADTSWPQYHSGILGKVQSLAQTVECALTDPERRRRGRSIYKDRLGRWPRSITRCLAHPKVRIPVCTSLRARRWPHVSLLCVDIPTRSFASQLPGPLSPLRRPLRNRLTKRQARVEGADAGRSRYRHALMFSAVDRAVKPSADKAGAFVLPLSREPYSTRST